MTSQTKPETDQTTDSAKRRAEHRMRLHDALPRACRLVSSRCCANVEIKDPHAAHASPDYFAAVIRDMDEEILRKIEIEDGVPARTSKSRRRI